MPSDTTTAPRRLRDYQIEASNAVIDTWAAGINRTVVVLPVGAGKSSVGADVAVRAHRDFGLNVAMIAHRAELLDQLAWTVGQVDPTLPPVGIVRAEQDDSDAPIIAASIQTLMNDARRERVGQRRVIIFDETHHASSDRWRQVLEDLGLYRSDHFFCGLTATLRREDGKALREVIQTVAYEKSMRWAIEQGFLVTPSGLTVRIPDLDLNKVKVRAGDFQNNDLAEVMEAANPYVVQAILNHAADRRPFIFAASVDAAHMLASDLTAAGMSASAVTGDMPYADRLDIYEAFRDGRTQALVTVQVLTEGADFPMCDCVVIARPTRSQNLYVQMCGRALRTHPGKTDALVLDLAGSSRVLSLVTLSDLDTGAVSKKVELDGTEVPPEDDEEVVPSGRKPRSVRQGPVDLVSIDLLSSAQTNVLWLQTRGGYPFIPVTANGYLVFLWPDGKDLWKIGRRVTDASKLIYHLDSGWEDDGKAWPLDVATGIAEDVIIRHGDPMPYRAASWRRNQAPSKGQVSFAKGLDIAEPEQYTKAALADIMSVTLASRWLDPR